ncbi:MAG: tyrosine-type recombinase/integrase [Bifidobacteriaceae bacterium]|nr:tyrosine-type recombinase/integrase [Bifidobacteriaceae bacterium]
MEVSREVDISIGELIAKADTEVGRLGLAASTVWQYRWAWSRFEAFCLERQVTRFCRAEADAFLDKVVRDHRDGVIKEWKRRLFRKAVLVLREVAETGVYLWSKSDRVHPNDSLGPDLRLVREEYEAWLSGSHLADATAELYSVVSRRALRWARGRGSGSCADLSGKDVPAMLSDLAGSYAGSMRTAVSALRSFCAFLDRSGRTAGLARAVPAVRGRRTKAVNVLTEADVEALVAVPDPLKPPGRRGKAVLLLGARSGLRSVDIVALELSDIDWKAARITLVQHKTGAALTVPLLADVGDAIADYLLNERPASADRRVFLRAKAPFTGLSPDCGFYHVASKAFKAAGVKSPEGSGRGMRVFRSALATRMLENETPLGVISGALGHRSPFSAKPYLAADEARLRGCCLDFAGIEPPQGERR